MKNKHVQVLRPPHRCTSDATGVHGWGAHVHHHSTTTQLAIKVPNVLERHVELLHNDTHQQKEIIALDICTRIPRGRKGDGRRSGGLWGVGQVWTFVLLCVVITLVLINDMVTYGHVKQAVSVRILCVCVCVII